MLDCAASPRIVSSLDGKAGMSFFRLVRVEMGFYGVQLTKDGELRIFKRSRRHYIVNQ